VLSVRLIAPVYLKNIRNAEFRSALQAAYHSTGHFTEAGQLPADTTLMLSVSRLDQVFDFYRAFFMAPELQRNFQLAEIVLDGFKINLRKDIVGLFDQRTVMAARPAQSSLIVMLNKDAQKDKTIDKVSTLLSTNVFPVKEETEQVGDVAVKTLLMGQGADGQVPDKLSYGTVGHALVFATPPDYVATAHVGNDKAKSLAETPLYLSLMQGMPFESKALAFIDLSRRQTAPGWIQALGLALWAEPFKKNEVDLLNGQLNLKLKAFEAQ
jgi:hypothetical protein